MENKEKKEILAKEKKDIVSLNDDLLENVSGGFARLDLCSCDNPVPVA